MCHRARHVSVLEGELQRLARGSAGQDHREDVVRGDDVACGADKHTDGRDHGATAVRPTDCLCVCVCVCVDGERSPQENSVMRSSPTPAENSSSCLKSDTCERNTFR